MREVAESGEGFGRGLVGFLGVDTRCGEELEIRPGVRLGQMEGAMHGGGAVAYADGEDGGKTGGLRCFKDLRQVLVVIYVTM